MGPEETIELLHLERGTCGYMASTYQSPMTTHANAGAIRTIGRAFYFLVTVDARIQLHRIWSDQIYHHYAGDPLEVLLLPPDAEATTAVVGSDLEGGMHPQLLIPAGTFHAGRLTPGGTSALLGTTSWPGVADGEFEFGDAGVLQQKYPDVASLIGAFMPTGGPAGSGTSNTG